MELDDCVDDDGGEDDNSSSSSSRWNGSKHEEVLDTGTISSIGGGPVSRDASRISQLLE
jgi:hypothetical protein